MKYVISYQDDEEGEPMTLGPPPRSSTHSVLELCSNDKVDKMLLGDATDLTDVELNYVNSFADPNRDFIISLFWRYLPIPLTGLSHVPDICESDYKFISENDAPFKKAIPLFTKLFLAMPMHDYFHHLLHNKYTPVFDIYANYHSIGDSIDQIEHWLKFQFKFEWRIVLQTIFDVVSLATLKKRSIWFVGDANSGKTYIMKPLAQLFLLVGYIKNLQGKGQFPFQDIYGKRILFLDEIIVPPVYYDDFKEIFAGQSILINRKFLVANVSFPAPCIICSNLHNVVNIDDPIWSSRIYKYEVTDIQHTLDAKLNRSLQVNPLAWLHVFNRNLDVNFA